ncbi:MAG TPA: hypothetical protein VFW83_00535, partial [Bryobacteraceae bacterium]|nr:hypothetical protein [Bryobacteraceae bacterium]
MGSKLQDRSAWLVALFILAGVLVPSACVLWFMNQAAKSQADAARQSVAGAYRGQLRLLRGQIDLYWADRATALRKKSEANPAAEFAHGIAAHLADSLIYLKPDGLPAYPALASLPLADPALDRQDWLAAQALEQRRDPGAAAAYAAIARSAQDPSIAARAAQAQIRSLLRSGHRQEALKTIRGDFVAGRMTKGLDLQGRLIAADERLLAMRLGQPGAGQRLVAFLNDYQRAGAAIPSAQRLFLMDEIGDVSQFPTYSAERLAQEFLEKGGIAPFGADLEQSGLKDVWKLAPAGSRVVALYRTATSSRRWAPFSNGRIRLGT